MTHPSQHPGFYHLLFSCEDGWLSTYNDCSETPPPTIPQQEATECNCEFGHYWTADSRQRKRHPGVISGFRCEADENCFFLLLRIEWR